MAWVVSACSHLSMDYQKPEVHLTKVQPLPSEGLEQRFVIGLRITNPNNMALDISGLSYSLSLQGSKVLTGVSNQVGRIEPYSENRVELESSASLMGGLRALISLMQAPQAVQYQLETQLNTAWWPWPVKVVESGEIELGK